MAGAIGRGDWLEAIGDFELDGRLWIVKGGLYCVESVEDRVRGTCGICANTQSGLTLIGVRNLLRCWCPCGFRLIGPGEERIAPPARISEAA